MPLNHPHPRSVALGTGEWHGDIARRTNSTKYHLGIECVWMPGEEGPAQPLVKEFDLPPHSSIMRFQATFAYTCHPATEHIGSQILLLLHTDLGDHCSWNHKCLVDYFNDVQDLDLRCGPTGKCGFSLYWDGVKDYLRTLELQGSITIRPPARTKKK